MWLGKLATSMEPACWTVAPVILSSDFVAFKFLQNYLETYSISFYTEHTVQKAHIQTISLTFA